MKIAIFSTHPFDRDYLIAANQTYDYELVFFEERLTSKTAILATGFSVVSCFVTDTLDKAVLEQLANLGVCFLALRSAGFNHVDLKVAHQQNILVARVPAYSPYSVAEFATGLILALNRKIHHAFNRVREHNFSLDGLLGFDIKGKTVGIIGTGKIGEVFCHIMHGFGAELIGVDTLENPHCLSDGLRYTTLADLYTRADIISLYCPLTPQTHHLIDATALASMKPGVMLINTSRGGLIDTPALISALKTRKIGALGLDVYEEEEGLFFHDLSSSIIQDDVFTRLQTFPNVLITSHQAFFTKEALSHIAATTLANCRAFETGQLSETLV